MITNTPKRWHWEDIKASLRKKGYPLKRIAHEKGYSPKSNITTLKTTTWPDLEKTIADIIGVQPMEIWPSRYKADGSPVGTGIRKKRSA